MPRRDTVSLISTMANMRPFSTRRALLYTSTPEEAIARGHRSLLAPRLSPCGYELTPENAITATDDDNDDDGGDYKHDANDSTQLHHFNLGRQGGYVKGIDIAKPGGISLLARGSTGVGRNGFETSIKGALWP